MRASFFIRTDSTPSAPKPHSTAEPESRRAADESLRVFSVGIGGIDLGLGKAIARASGEATGSGEAAPASSSEPPASPRPATAGRAAERASGIEVPDHGFKGDEAERFFGGSRLRRGRVVQGPGQEWRWVEHVAGIDAPDVRVRRRISDPGGRPPIYERVEDGSFLRYRFEVSDAALGAVRVASPLIAPESWRDPSPPSSETGPSTLPSGLAMLSIVPIAAVAGEDCCFKIHHPACVGLQL